MTLTFSEARIQNDGGVWLFLKELEPLGFHSRDEIREYIYEYMRGFYPGWTPESVKYHKWGDLK